MNSREFRRKHDSYVDGTLPGVDIDAMTQHLRFCAECARVDTRVRRALLLAHNLPMIEPSPAFGERLQARLRQERAIMAGHAARHGTVEGRWRSLTMGTYAALAAGVMATAGLALAMTRLAQPADAIRLAPVVATLPEHAQTMLASSAMVASVWSAGCPFVIAQWTPSALR